MKCVRDCRRRSRSTSSDDNADDNDDIDEYESMSVCMYYEAVVLEAYACALQNTRMRTFAGCSRGGFREIDQ
mgnify:CR=1 FL=1